MRHSRAGKARGYRFVTVLVAMLSPSVATGEQAASHRSVHRMTASFDYALRNRLEDRDGFWFLTYEVRGHAFGNDSSLPSLTLTCVGSAWGHGERLGGEDGLCRLADGGLNVLFARVLDAEGSIDDAALAFTLHGGRGQFAGYAGTATVRRGMDLSGERPTGKGSMQIRLVLDPLRNAAE
jgi:hypothetical protein